MITGYFGIFEQSIFQKISELVKHHSVTFCPVAKYLSTYLMLIELTFILIGNQKKSQHCNWKKRVRSINWCKTHFIFDFKRQKNFYTCIIIMYIFHLRQFELKVHSIYYRDFSLNCIEIIKHQRENTVNQTLQKLLWLNISTLSEEYLKLVYDCSLINVIFTNFSLQCKTVITLLQRIGSH